ncbi:hypothetical protein C0992_011663 [Termitomyces sp. T32_za158]|nr:hypothetical protein C0992_011663 [Termitomyces sp. T32_za158]
MSNLNQLRSADMEKFECLWWRLSPHGSLQAQEWQKRVFYTKNGQDVCDTSIIHEGFESTFAVRDEYHKLDTWLTKFLHPRNLDEMVRQRKTFATVTGQQGIGKSVFMLWLLCKRVAAGLPTTWQTPSALYLFGYRKDLRDPPQFLSISLEGNESFNYKAFLSMPETWNLVDAEPLMSNLDAPYNAPCAALVGHPSSAPGAKIHWPIILFCSSHRPRKSHWFTKDRGGARYYMEPWKLQEVLNCKAIGLFEGISKADLVSRYREVDGCIRQLIAREDVWIDYHKQLVSALAALSDPNAIHEAFVNQYQRNYIDASNILYVLPSPESRMFFHIRPGSRYIQEILMKKIQEWQADQKQAFWKLSLATCRNRAFPGSIYESFTHTKLRKLTLISHGTESEPLPLTLPTKEAQTSFFSEDTTSLAQTTTWYILPDSPNLTTIDSVLLTNDQRVFLLQITLEMRYPVTEEGLDDLEKLLPEWAREVPWYFCFVGLEQKVLQEMCSKPDIGTLNQKWQEKLEFRWIHLPFEDICLS